MRIGDGKCGNKGRKRKGKDGKKRKGIDINGSEIKIVEYFKDNEEKKIIRVDKEIKLKRKRNRRIKD